MEMDSSQTLLVKVLCSFSTISLQITMDEKMKRNYIPYLRISFLMLLIYHIGSVEAEIVKKGLVSYWSFDRPPIKVEIQGLVEKMQDTSKIIRK